MPFLLLGGFQLRVVAEILGGLICWGGAPFFVRGKYWHTGVALYSDTMREKPGRAVRAQAVDFVYHSSPSPLYCGVVCLGLWQEILLQNFSHGFVAVRHRFRVRQDRITDILPVCLRSRGSTPSATHWWCQTLCCGRDSPAMACPRYTCRRCLRRH